jgi:acyl dehydratase
MPGLGWTGLQVHPTLLAIGKDGGSGMVGDASKPAQRLVYFEDLVVGELVRSGPATLTADEIVAFAGEFDPQPFHVDPEAARDSLFGGLAASGWHTAALTMRMLVEGPVQLAGGFIGAGVESLQWPRPVRPGDTLRIEWQVLEKRESRSKPEIGLARLRTTTLNQADQPVQVMTSTNVVRRRTA